MMLIKSSKSFLPKQNLLLRYAAHYRHRNKDVDFRNTRVAFQAKSNFELLRGYLVFSLCSSKFLVTHNKKIMDVAKLILGQRIFSTIMKASIYGHFVAGEKDEEIRSYINQSRKFGVKSILDYSAEEDISDEKAKEMLNPSITEEKIYRPNLKFADRSEKVYSARTYFYESEAKCDKNMTIFLKCIDSVSDSTKKEGFAAIKLTALGRPQFLLQMSDFLLQMQKMFDLLSPETSIPENLRRFDVNDFQNRLDDLGIEISYDEKIKWFTLLDVSGDGNVDLLDWSQLKNLENDYASLFRIKDKKTGEMQQIGSTLREDGVLELRNMIRRIDTIAQHAQDKEVRVMIDAEQSYFQPAIRRIAMEMMRKFNKKSPIIFNTYQCYLKDALNHLAHDLNMAKVENFFFGAKLVRGAYIDQERKRALDLGYPDPINNTYEITTRMYHDCLEYVLTEIKKREKGKISVMLATHNENTIQFALDKMAEYDIRPQDKLICFGQLLGMCDHISYGLGDNGYSVYKYVPYGPVNEVLPYLSRRLAENQSILQNLSRELSMTKSEIKRRLFSRE